MSNYMHDDFYSQMKNNSIQVMDEQRDTYDLLYFLQVSSVLLKLRVGQKNNPSSRGFLL